MSATIISDNEWDYDVVHLKSTDKDGGVTYTEHTCWNAKRFVLRCHLQAAEVGGKVEQITAEDYRAQRKARR